MASRYLPVQDTQDAHRRWKRCRGNRRTIPRVTRDDVVSRYHLVCLRDDTANLFSKTLRLVIGDLNTHPNDICNREAVCSYLWKLRETFP